MNSLLEAISPTARELLRFACGVTCGGCGHLDSLDRFAAGQPAKQLQCPACQRIEIIQDGPATVFANGFVMPGQRTVAVIPGRKHR